MQFSPTHSSNRINKLADCLAARSYLEIGVCKGTTFFNVSIENKDGVDPKFLFDFKNLETDTVRLFPMTSDAFFGTHADTIYDVIFLDGLHTFQQTFRDFCCSLSFAHRKTVWIIDDTMPTDIFSAHRDADVAIQVREQHGTKNSSWHGDVYKMVPAINDFFPQMRYLTICTDQNPQTLAWFEPREEFSPKFNNFELIERLDYFQYLELKDIYNPYMDEDEAILRVRQGVM